MQSKAEVNSVHLKLYEYFTSMFGTPSNVYYPGCGNDATPGLGFPESRVVFLDSEPKAAIITSRIPSAYFIRSKAEDYSSSTPFDLVIDMHSHAPFADEVKDLKVGGHLIIADKMADRAFDDPRFELVGAAKYKYEDGNAVDVVLSTNDLEKHLEEEPRQMISFSSRRKNKAAYYIFINK
jgi:hypothetical protein